MNPLLPQMPPWTGTGLQVLATAVPATIAVVFGMIILLIGLFLPDKGRKYAMSAADRTFSLVEGLFGASDERLFANSSKRERDSRARQRGRGAN